MMTPLYRFRQGLRAMFAWSQPLDDSLAADSLSPALYALFRQMQRGERLHSLRVLRAVLAQEATTPTPLVEAALLHDVGKICAPQHLVGKTLPVLVKAARPTLLNQLASSPSRTGWRSTFVAYVHHPTWSAELIEAAGGSPATVWLARFHQTTQPNPPDPEWGRWLNRLQQADDTN